MLKKSWQCFTTLYRPRHAPVTSSKLWLGQRWLSDNVPSPLGTTHTTVKIRPKERKAEEFLQTLGPEMLEKKAHIEIDWHTLQTSGYQVPQHLSAHDWKILLTECPTYSKRRTYFYYLFKRELHRENDKRRKLRLKENYEKTEIENNLNEEKFLFRTTGKFIKRRQGELAACFGNPFIIDLDYKQSRREAIATYRQLITIHAENTSHLQPFNIHLTGASNFFVENEHKDMLQTMLDMQVCQDSFIDLFPAERLVYLTPDGPPLNHYDGNDVFIMAGLVDLHDTSRRSLSKAKSLGIRHGSLPLRRHVVLKNHTLTLDCVLRILLDVNLHHDWKNAIWKNIPTRLIYNAPDHQSDPKPRFSKELKEIYSSA